MHVYALELPSEGKSRCYEACVAFGKLGKSGNKNKG